MTIAGTILCMASLGKIVWHTTIGGKELPHVRHSFPPAVSYHSEAGRSQIWSRSVTLTFLTVDPSFTVNVTIVSGMSLRSLLRRS